MTTRTLLVCKISCNSYKPSWELDMPVVFIEWFWDLNYSVLSAISKLTRKKWKKEHIWRAMQKFLFCQLGLNLSIYSVVRKREWSNMHALNMFKGNNWQRCGNNWNRSLPKGLMVDFANTKTPPKKEKHHPPLHYTALFMHCGTAYTVQQFTNSSMYWQKIRPLCYFLLISFIFLCERTTNYWRSTHITKLKRKEKTIGGGQYTNYILVTKTQWTKYNFHQNWTRLLQQPNKGINK